MTAIDTSVLSEPGHLREEASVNQRSCKVGRRFALNEHLVLNQVIAGRETGHLDVEGAAKTDGLEQRRAAFGMVDGDLMSRVCH
jgi:hypothetical protein